MLAAKVRPSSHRSKKESAEAAANDAGPRDEEDRAPKVVLEPAVPEPAVAAAEKGVRRENGALQVADFGRRSILSEAEKGGAIEGLRGGGSGIRTHGPG